MECGSKGAPKERIALTKGSAGATLYRFGRSAKRVVRSGFRSARGFGLASHSNLHAIPLLSLELLQEEQVAAVCI